MGWGFFICGFGGKQVGTDQFINARRRVKGYLDVTEEILRARGTGDLPTGSLDTIESRWESLWEIVKLADTTSDTKLGKAVQMLEQIEDTAMELATDAGVLRQAEERRERLRREDKKVYDFKLLEAEGLMISIEVLGGTEPPSVRQRINSAKVTDDPATSRQLMTAIGLLNGILPLLAVLEGAAVSLKGMKARVVATKESEEEAIEEISNLVFAAIKDADPPKVQEALTEFMALCVNINSSFERTLELLTLNLDPRGRYAQLKLRIDDIVDYPDEFASPALKDLRNKVRSAVATVELRIQQLGVKEEAKKTATDPNDEALRKLNGDIVLATEAADEAVTLLVTALDNAAKVQAPHDQNMRLYYAELKKLQPRIDLANALPKTDTSGDTAWKAEREAYDLAMTALKDEVKLDKRDYAEGLKKLAELKKKIDALAKKKVQSLQTDINTATDSTSGSADKTRRLVATLSQTPGLIAALEPAQQLAILKSLREQVLFCKRCDENFSNADFKSASYKCPTCNRDDRLDIPAYCSDDDCMNPGMWTSTNPCPECGNDDWKYDTSVTSAKQENDLGQKVNHPNRWLLEARAVMFSQMQLTPEFEKWDDKKRKATIQELRKDPEFAIAEANWSSWVTALRTGDNTAKQQATQKILAYAQSVIKKQCAILGHNQTGLSRENDSGVVETFPDVPVKVELETPVPAKPGLYGYCKAGFPTWMVLNTTNRQFDDFKEIVDTLVHENAHAFQEMLIKKLKAEAPFTDLDRTTLESDPDLGVQAKLFLENDESYINRDTLGTNYVSRGIADTAYRHEPVEEHSWTTGGVVSTSLLVPPPIEDFRSSRTMRSKTWMVASITRGANAVVTLVERHGFYVDEWQGEKAGDKKLSLDNLPESGARVTKPLTVLSIVDSRTLRTNLNTSGFDEDPDNNGFVPPKLVRMFLDVRVQDL
ncbi:MAG: hypothetical protein H6740_27175 [Alphaproteobacteria bacterium]|nr:hypothetical protein [Alphaproteobacteria bacterium]